MAYEKQTPMFDESDLIERKFSAVDQNVEASAKTATNYITEIDSRRGITVKPADSDGNDYLQMNSTAIDFYRNNSSVMHLEDSTGRFGSASGQRVELASDGVDIYNKNGYLGTEIGDNGLSIFDGTADGNKLAEFTSERVMLGDEDNTYAEISKDNLNLIGSSLISLNADSYMPVLGFRHRTGSSASKASVIGHYAMGLSLQFQDDSAIVSRLLLSTDGHIYINGNGLKYFTNGTSHSSPVGTIIGTYLASTKAVANSTWVNAISLNIPIGTWVVTYGARFPSNATGYRNMNLNTGSAVAKTDVDAMAVSGNVTQLRCSKVLEVTSNTMYYLNIYQTSGASLTLPASAEGEGTFIQAVRIL